MTLCILFTRILAEQEKLYGRSDKAILETIRICKDRDILREYLEQREQEVYTIMKSLFSQEDAVTVYGKEQKNEGKEEQARKTALNLARTGMDPKQIASVIDYSVEKVEEWTGPQPA